MTSVKHETFLFACNAANTLLVSALSQFGEEVPEASQVAMHAAIAEIRKAETAARYTKKASKGQFTRYTGTDYCGGHLVGEFECSYTLLVKLFGEPEEGGEYKVSGEWQVTDGKESFSIYDYKATALYDEDCYPTVAEFRAQPSYSWHIGGTASPKNLIAFLKSKLDRQ